MIYICWRIQIQLYTTYMVGGCAPFSPCNHGLMAQSASCDGAWSAKKTLPRPIFSNPILGNPNGISNFLWYLDFFFLYLWHMVYQGKSFESLEECGLGGGIMYNAIYVWYFSIHNRKFYLILFYHLKKPLYQLYNTIL